jgi:hypothetical protein
MRRNHVRIAHVTAAITLSVAVLAGAVVLLLWYGRRVRAGTYPYPTEPLSYTGFPELSLGGGGTVVVVTDYNESAGFGWLLYNALNTFHLCDQLEQGHARPVVFFTKGLYVESRPEHVAIHAAQFDYDPVNWFNNYFEPLEPVGWRPFLKHHFAARVYAPAASLSTGRGVVQFDRSSLNALQGGRRDWPELWNRFLRPRKHILEAFHALRTSMLGAPGENFIYAVHYRGTDKYDHSGVQNPITGAVVGVSSEDEPEHVPYQWVFAQLAERIQENAACGRHGAECGYKVYVASDEQPFVDAAKAAFAAWVVVAKPNTIRSVESTSGLDMDTRLCGVGRGRGIPECGRLQELVDSSVHRGYPEKSGYHKGEDVLLETMLLSEADVFLRSRGNFSNLPTYMKRNRTQHVVDMVSLWKATRAQSKR